MANPAIPVGGVERQEWNTAGPLPLLSGLRNMLYKALPLGSGGPTSMPMKLMTGAALAAAALAGAAPAEAQSFQNLVETFYDNEFRAHPIAATSIGGGGGLAPGDLGDAACNCRVRVGPAAFRN